MRPFMKISILFIFFLFCGLMTTLPSFAQEAPVEGQTTSTSSVEKEQQAGSGSSKKETQQFVIRVRTKQKVDFSGTVTRIDPAIATLSIRNQGKTISFDMSRAILIGYGNISEIKKGDDVSVGYNTIRFTDSKRDICGNRSGHLSPSARYPSKSCRQS